MPLEMSRGSTPATPQVAEASGATVGVALMYCSNGLACVAGGVPRPKPAATPAARSPRPRGAQLGPATKSRWWRDVRAWRKTKSDVEQNAYPLLSMPLGLCKGNLGGCVKSSFPDKASDVPPIVIDAIVVSWRHFSFSKFPRALRRPGGRIGGVRLLGDDGIDDRSGREQSNRRGDGDGWRWRHGRELGGHRRNPGLGGRDRQRRRLERRRGWNRRNHRLDGRHRRRWRQRWRDRSRRHRWRGRHGRS